MAKARARKVRIHASVNADVAKKLVAIAHARKVSKSWAIARAVEKYVEEEIGEPEAQTSFRPSDQ